LIIIDLPVFIYRPLPEVVDAHFQEPLVFCPFHDRVLKGTFQEFGKDGENIDLHAAKLKKFNPENFNIENILYIRFVHC
jgi:hypothetical protein